jgi:general stress protein YciG
MSDQFKAKRGFAAMDPAKQRLIARSGGHAAHEKKRAHEFSSEEARIAGRKGGHAAHQKGTAHEFTPEEARNAGSKGGRAPRGERNRAMTLEAGAAPDKPEHQ